MVMHARKPQRISDGYFEKHQTHPYQKYSSKNERRVAGEYGGGDSRYSPLRSPNGNVGSHGHAHAHAHHHYAHCADDRPYVTTRNSYAKCDKERDRDYKSSRDKYTDSVRSPKEKRNKECERERSNHERSDGEKKPRGSTSRSSKFERRAGSGGGGGGGCGGVGSGVGSGSASGEWTEHISSSGKKYYYNSVSEVSQWERPRDWDSRRTSSKDNAYSSRNHDKGSSMTAHNRRDIEKSNKRNSSGSDRYWNSNNAREDDCYSRSRSERKRTSHEEGQSLQDMDISPDRSTPLSEGSYGARDGATHAGATNTNVGLAVSADVVGDGAADGGSPVREGEGTSGNPPLVVLGPLVCIVSPQRDAGPPTPTHSENTDPHAPPLHLDNALPRKMECLGSYSSVVGSVAAPMLTPSLVNYVREELTAHVSSWPAELLERQAHKYTEEAHQLSCMHCTRVSAELKCARSLVRHAEIQATLHEQKIMYLRQQISRLEDLKAQNSFMSDD